MLKNVIILCMFVISTNCFSETYEVTKYLRTLNKDIISTDKAMNLIVFKNKKISDFVSLGDYYIYNNKYRNTFKSFGFYKEAAIRGSEYSKMMVGYMYYKGYGVDANTIKGEHLLLDVKKPFDKNSKLLLAIIFENDGFYSKSIPLLKGVKDPLSYSLLVKLLSYEKKYKESIPYLLWIINETNDQQAKMLLGEIYLSLNHLNEKEALKLLISSSNKGNDNSQYILGMYYFMGTKSSKADIEEATRWFLISAQHGNKASVIELLKIWNDNQTNNNLYHLDNNKALTKKLNDYFTNNN